MVLRRLSTVVLALVAALLVSILAWERAEGETYEQVVDNSDKGRFEASGGWKKGDAGKGVHGGNYRFAKPKSETMRSQGTRSGAAAAFKVKIPSDGKYAVYARWPEAPGLNDRARVEVLTSEAAVETTEVDQTRNGGRWVRVGTYEMDRGDDYSVRFSRDAGGGKGKIVADAVKVVRVSSGSSGPSSDEAEPEGEGSGRQAEETRSTSNVRSSLMMAARSYKGRPYRYATCNAYMSCVCLTKRVFATVGYNLPMKSEEAQVRYGYRVPRGAPLLRGDLVFFREGGGRDITHVGIYAGRGYIWHASSYFGKVVRSEMRYIYGYAGAKRLV